MIALFICSSPNIWAQNRNTRGPLTNYVIIVIEGRVEVARSGSQVFDLARTNQALFIGDRVRIGPKSQLTIRRSDQSIYRFYEKAEFQVAAPKTAGSTSPTVRLMAGILYFFHRGKPGPFDVETRTASAAIRGTEFALEIDAAGTTVLTVIDGVVDLSNDVNSIAVQNGQQGVAQPGQAPFLRAAIDAINIIQWTLYYPGILAVDEVPLTEQEGAVLAASLTAYRAGDLLRAVAEYPAERQPQSDAERIYLAGLLLSVGQVDDAQGFLAPFRSTGATQGTQASTNARLAGALQQVISAVQLRAPTNAPVVPDLASEWLAESYRLQSVANLEEALRAARNAVQKSPEFGFGWARVAELEFSFGRTDEASKAAAKALQLSPRNAQAIALNGFLFAARNKIDLALEHFDQAIAIDGSLANAWLGRGLCLIRTGKSDAGREDLLTAAALEPQRAFLRSYLGKAWTDAGEMQLAERELELAKRFDPRDPTAWLYSALLKHQNNRINEAIRDLEHAQDLNTNRAIFRSGFLLDQDRAVRSANLARIYRDAGMTDWSMREAGRAVSADYANYSAHLFLANSYDELRDPNRINLRYETPAESEYLIANLLAPVGAGLLSQSISQGEYSKLFERDRLGVVSTTEYLSRGAWSQNGAQFGTFGNSSYSFEGVYRNDPGQRPNNDFEETELRLHLKQQLSAKDSVYLRAIYYDAEGGDRFQYYDPANAHEGLRTLERSEPTLHLGYHHEWSPGVHTLFLAGRLSQEFSFADPILPSQFIIQPPGSDPVYAELIQTTTDFREELEIYTAEAQQVWQRERHSLVLGGRFQTGEDRARIFQPSPPNVQNSDILGFFDPEVPLTDASSENDIQQISGYLYYTWQAFDSLRLIGGVAYEETTFPANRWAAPPQSQETEAQLSPKAGFVWDAAKNTTVRFAYDRSLRGANVDQGYHLEPTQVAGINRSYRNILPETVGGGSPGAEFETFGLALDHRFPSATYLGVSAGVLRTEGKRLLQSFVYDGESVFAQVSATPSRFDYREESIQVQLNQQIGDDWSAGAAYRLTYSTLDEQLTGIPEAGPVLLGITPFRSVSASLHQIALDTTYRHRSGVFGQLQANWYQQSNQGYEPDIPGDDLWQLNFIIGYRIPRPQAEFVIGLLNLTDQDYRLNPLTLLNDLPRERTFVTRLRFSF